MGKIVRGLIIVVAGGSALAIAALSAWVYFAWDRHFSAPYPAIRASTDARIVDHGHYLVYGPAHCAGCHVAPENQAQLAAGGEPPLAGGLKFPLGDLGTIWSANITPDNDTGIGKRTDGELARVLRYSVHADGRAVLPFMEFQTLSDTDLTAVISFLRSQAPVPHAVPAMDMRLKGKIALAFFVKPQGPRTAPPVSPPSAADAVAYGGYLVNAVMQCAGCHTDRSMTDGSDIGPRFAGGWTRVSDTDPKITLVTPNLTPDPETGRIAKWSAETFVARFRTGKLMAASDMPWALYGRMTDDDLRAVYRYLHSLAPVKKDTGASVRRTG